MYKYKVDRVEWETDSTLLVTIARSEDEHKIFSFQPGQYAAISHRKGLRISPARCFSIVSSPTHQNMLQFSMRVRGRFTHGMARVKVGDEVDVRGPFGGFVFDVERDARPVLIAGGIGITPFMSMMEFATVTKASNRIDLVYGVNKSDDIPFYDEIKTYSNRNHKLHATYVVAEGPLDHLPASSRQGRIDEEVIDSVVGDGIDECTFFICGPPVFMTAVLKLLKQRGVSSDRIVTEAFSQGNHRQTGKVVSWPQDMYVLGGAGLALGSVGILVSDIFKTLPNTPLKDNEAINQPLVSGTQRERDLSNAIKSLPSNLSSTRVSPTATKAIKEAKKVKTKTITSGESTTVNQSQIITTQPAQTSAPPRSQPTQQPVPAPTPKCTTSQSGVKTCQ